MPCELSGNKSMAIPASPMLTPIHLFLVNMDLKMIPPSIIVNMGVNELRKPASALSIFVSAMQKR